MKQNSLHKRYL